MTFRLQQIRIVGQLATACVMLVLLTGCQRADRAASGDADPDGSSAALDQIGLVSHPADIEQLVGALSAVDRHQLRQRRSRFESLDEAEKDRLRQFHRQVCKSDSGTELYAVLRRYRDWLVTIPDGQRADLLELPAEQRIAKIREIRQSQQVSSFRAHAGDIPPEDVMTVARWLHDYVQENRQELLAQLPNGAQTRIGRMQDGRRKQRLLFFEVVKNLKAIDLPNPEQAKLQQLQNSLSSEGASRLGELVDLEDSGLGVRHLLTEFAESMRRRMPSKERLMEFYKNDLTQQQQDRVDQLAPDEAQRELRKLFMRQMHSRGDGDRRDGGRRGPPRRPGDRGGPLE